MTLSCRITARGPGWRAGRSIVFSSFLTFRFPSVQRKQCGKQDMENKRVDALTRSHQFRYCIFPLFPPRFTFNAALHRALYFEPDFITVDTNDVNASHSIMPL